MPAGAGNGATPPTVDVVVVNWNAREYLTECLEAVYESTALTALGRVVVVDNASTDESIERARTWLGRDRSMLIVNQENRGFAAACNQGARAGSAPYVLFLNPDTRVRPGCIERTIDFLESSGGRPVGLCGARVVDRDGRPTIAGGPFPTLRLITGQVSGLSRVLPGLFPSKRIAGDAPTGPIDHAIGAYLLVRRDVFERLDGFDEGFFVYYEEVDLCRRARDLGWLTYHLAEAEVLHVGNVSTDQARAQRLAYSLTSRRRYARKHWSRRANVLLTLVTFGIELPARLSTELLRRRRWPAETLRGYRQFVVAARHDLDVA